MRCLRTADRASYSEARDDHNVTEETVRLGGETQIYSSQQLETQGTLEAQRKYVVQTGKHEAYF